MIDMGRRCVLKYNNSKLVVGFTVGFLVIGITVFIMLDNRSSHSAKLDTAGNPAGSHQEKTGVVSEASAAAVSPVVSQAPEATSNPVSSSAVPTPDPSPDPAAEPAALKYQGAVEHIFFHPLIAYPELAFDGDSMAKGYNDWFITVKEFAKILDSLYANQYVLIDIHSLYEETEMDGKTIVKAKELWLPPGKKPLVLSIDDLNYYTYIPYLKVRSDSVMMDRRHIDGIAFEDQKKRLLPLFDVNDVIDESRLSQAKAGVK